MRSSMAARSADHSFVGGEGEGGEGLGGGGEGEGGGGGDGGGTGQAVWQTYFSSFAHGRSFHLPVSP